MKLDHSIRTISLFSGAGGLDIGVEKAGFDIVYATDFDETCCETLMMNRGGTLSDHLVVEQADIRELDLSHLPQNVDFVIGGPPCQTFSASARRAGGAAGQLDPRGTLFEGYVRVLKHVKPKAFLFENVRGILGTNKGKDFQDIVKAFSDIGYKIDYRILDAEDYGAPQQRERVFIVGHRDDSTFLFPRPTYGPDSKDGKPYVAVKDAISDLVLTDEEKQETKFEGGRYTHLLPEVPPGGNYLHFTAKRGYPKPIFAYRSRFSDFLYKANPETPTKTLIASPGKYTGPLHWDNRYMTVREFKRIQGFPDDHVFAGNRTRQVRQIGNSVCPIIAYHLAIAIRDQLFHAGDSPDEYLSVDESLSFDRRKAAKAQKTRKLHTIVAKTKQQAPVNGFTLSEYKSTVTPVIGISGNNVTARVPDDSTVKLTVKSDKSRKLQARMTLTVQRGFEGLPITVKVSLYGEHEHGVQTMWNAVDDWVVRSSHYNSLMELYGHFTEPHPIFSIDDFDCRSDLPIVKFAMQCSDFSNCSRYFPNERLIDMWKGEFGATSFASLIKRLREYRFDIRSNETNITIPKGVYMVAYPFSLPYVKQMNFSVRMNDDA